MANNRLILSYLGLSMICNILCSPLIIDSSYLRSVFLPSLFHTSFDNINTTNRPMITEECRQKLFETISKMDTGQLEPVKMFNSFGDFPPKGFISGTLADFGHYDQCLDTADAQYCLLETDIPLPAREANNPECLTLYHQIPDVLPEALQRNTNATFYQHLANHSVLFYYTNIQTGICLPSQCTPNDAKQIGTLITKKLDLSPSRVYCEKKIHEFRLDRIQIFAIIILFTVLLLNLNSLILSWLNPEGTQNSILKWFNPYCALQKLLYSPVSENDLGAIHGIRAITILWIICAHAVDWNPPNLIHSAFSIRDAFGAFIPQLFYKAYYGVDTFFYISGLLTSYVTLKFTSGHYSKFNTLGFLFVRYVRLTPQLLIYLLFTPLLGLFVSGPIWHKMETFMTRTCSTNWFLNVLYVQNFIDIENICSIHTWYLATDMQLHWASLIPMLFILKRFALGLWIVKALIGITTLLAALYIFFRQLSPGILITARLDYVDELFRPREFAKFFYRPWSHSFVFFSGFLLGCYAWKVNKTKKRIKFKSWEQYTAWSVAVLLYIFCTWSTLPWLYGRKPSPLISSILYPLNLTLWSCMLTIVLWLCLTGNGGIINRLLSHSGWRLLSRLAYSLYLTHPWVIAVVVGSRREPLWLNPVSILTFWSVVICLSIILALIFSILFEVPLFQFMEHLKNRATKSRFITDKSERHSTYQMESMVSS